MITAAQIRGARAMSAMSVEDLAKAAGLSVAEVEALERQDGGAPSALQAVKQALESAGVVFIASGNQDEGGPGLRLRARPVVDEGLRPEELNSTNDD